MLGVHENGPTSFSSVLLAPIVPTAICAVVNASKSLGQRSPAPGLVWKPRTMTFVAVCVPRFFTLT